METLLHIDKSKAEQLVEKWTPVLDYSSDKISPIENENTRLNTAILLENQEKWCFENTSGGGTGGVFGYGSSPVNNGATGGAFGNSDSYAGGDARLPRFLYL